MKKKAVRLRAMPTGGGGILPSVAPGPAWMTDPARGCYPGNVHDIDIWYSTDAGEQTLAKKICSRCPFKRQCADWAEQHNERWGIWGAVTRSNSHHVRADPVARDVVRYGEQIQNLTRSGRSVRYTARLLRLSAERVFQVLDRLAANQGSAAA